MSSIATRIVKKVIIHLAYTIQRTGTFSACSSSPCGHSIYAPWLESKFQEEIYNKIRTIQSSRRIDVTFLIAFPAIVRTFKETLLNGVCIRVAPPIWLLILSNHLVGIRSCIYSIRLLVCLALP